jgi:hypothetical protein
MNSVSFRKTIGLISNLLIVVLSHFHPVLGLVAGIVRHLVVGARPASQPTESLVAELLSPSIPAEFARSIAEGIISDAVEADSLGYAIKSSVPYNNVLLKCDECREFRHYYVRRSGSILSTRCLVEELDTEVAHQSKVFYFYDDAKDLKRRMDEAKRDENLNPASPFGGFSRKYYSFRRRFDRNA